MTEPSKAKLIFFCAKMAAGKSTLARELARRDDAVLLVEDEFLAGLYPNEVVDVAAYVKLSRRIRRTLVPHVRDLLSRGVSVVLDFAGNTKSQRQWFRDVIDEAEVPHELHFIDASDEVCKRQLRERSAALPPGAAWTSDADFDAITAYFEPPASEEAFNVILHDRRSAESPPVGR